jgi:hypothetical protein
MKRAAKGGQVGVNGEFYEGGKFLPRNPERPRQDCAGRASKARKIQIEPGVFIEAPHGYRPIIEIIVGADYDRESKQFALWPEDHKVWASYNRETIAARVNAFNAGERVTLVG